MVAFSVSGGTHGDAPPARAPPIEQGSRRSRAQSHRVEDHGSPGRLRSAGSELSARPPRVIEIEVISRDGTERRRSVEARTADIAGFKIPSWSSVMGRDYVPWSSPRLVVDTAILTPDEAFVAIKAAIDGLSRRAPPTS